MTKIYKVMAALLDERLLKIAVVAVECQSVSKRVKAKEQELHLVAPCSFNGTAAIGTAKC